MVLSYPGGIYLPFRARAARLLQTPSPAEVGQVYLPLGKSNAKTPYTLHVQANTAVQAGALVAEQADGSPVYATIPGVFEGIYAVAAVGEGDAQVHYARICALQTDDSPLNEEAVLSARQAETAALTDLQPDELLDAVRTLGIRDTHSGDWLWKRFQRNTGRIRRVVLQAMDDGWSSTEEQAALQSPQAALGGAKVALYLLGASKLILLTDQARKQVTKAFKPYLTDPKLIAAVQIRSKYPVCEETLYEAIYAKQLPHGRTADDEGVFFLRAQTAAALFRALTSGKPMLSSVLTAAGDGFARDVLLQLPMGTLWQRIQALAALKKGAYTVQSDSPLHGKPVSGVWNGSETILYAHPPVQSVSSPCISCGRCGEVCPVHLQPYRILHTKQYRLAKTMAAVCIGCGCCDYICPSRIPLRAQIAQQKQQTER